MGETETPEQDKELFDTICFLCELAGTNPPSNKASNSCIIAKGMRVAAKFRPEELVDLFTEAQLAVFLAHGILSESNEPQAEAAPKAEAKPEKASPTTTRKGKKPSRIICAIMVMEESEATILNTTNEEWAQKANEIYMSFGGSDNVDVTLYQVKKCREVLGHLGLFQST